MRTASAKPGESPFDRVKCGPNGIISNPGAAVKGKIVSAGVKLGDLAEAANISRPALSNYLSGRRRNWRGQIAIWIGFLDLTGSTITLEEFWGELLAERKAG